MKNLIDNKIISKIQEYLGVIIIFLFILGIFTVTNVNVFRTLFLILAIQIIISGLRKRFLNSVIEFVLLMFSALFRMPALFKDFFLLAFIVGVVLFIFKIIAVIIAVLDYSTFGNDSRYQRVKFYTSSFGSKTQQKGKRNKLRPKRETKEKDNKEEVIDVEFNEK